MLKHISMMLFSAVVVAGSLPAGEYSLCKNMRFDRGKAVPFVQQEPFFKLDFGENPDCWDLTTCKNYAGLLKINPKGTLFGEKCLLVTRQKKNQAVDTAWSLSTRPYNCEAVPGPMFVTVVAASSEDLEKLRTVDYPCHIEWRDAEGKTLSCTPIYFAIDSKKYTEFQSKGIIPAGTSSFVIRIGMDTPNIGDGQFFAVKSIQLISTAKNLKYCRQYHFETSPMAAGDGKISWKAETPSGTAVKIAVSTAPDDNGVPGQWSAFGKEYAEAFVVREPWVRFKVVHYTAGNRYPTLDELNLGGRKEFFWHSLREAPTPLVENLTSVGPTENTRADIVLRITCPTPVNWNTLSVTVDNRDVTSKLNRKGDIVTYKTAVPYKKGRHVIKVSVGNIAGKTVDQIKYLVIGKKPAAPQVTLRDDGMTLIDGKPFFPVGIYGVWKCDFNRNDFDNCMKGLKDAGFNLIHTYYRVNDVPEGEEFFAAGRKYGLKFWFNGRDPFNRHLHRKHIKNPDIIVWYTGDDTSSHTTPAKLLDVHDGLKAVDGTRLTGQADGAGAYKKVTNYRDFVLSSDIFMAEIYPVNKDTQLDREKSVAEVINDMKSCLSDIAVSRSLSPRAVWAIIQYFEGWSGWKRFPEENELRAMSYAALIHGAKGIIWYTYGKNSYNPEKKIKKGGYGVNSTPERWRIMTSVSREISRLIPILTERTPEQQPATPTVVKGPTQDYYGNPSVTGLLKKHNGKRYLFVVNAVRKPVTAQFFLPGLTSGKTLFDDRVVQVKNGVLTDDFKPYGVHIYEF